MQQTNHVGGVVNSIANLYFTCVFAMGTAIALVVGANMFTTGIELAGIPKIATGFYFVGFIVSVAILLVSPAAREKAKLMVLYPFGLVLVSMAGFEAPLGGDTTSIGAGGLLHAVKLLMYVFPIAISALLFIRAFEERAAKAKV